MQTVAKGILAVLLAALMAAPGMAQSSRSRRMARDLEVYQKQHDRLHLRFTEALEALAAQEEQRGQADEAARLRTLAQPVDPQAIRFEPLPRKLQSALPADTPPEVRFRETQLRKHREDYAKALYLLSRQSLHAGHLGYAYDLVRETAVHDPDHASARKILGFERLGDEWMSPSEAEMKRKGNVWHAQFGWIPERDVPRYEQGERRYDGSRWVSASREAELRRDFQSAWDIKTEHFQVRTNHSLEKGVDLAAQLEDFYGLCRQTLAGFFYNPEQLQLLFDGKNDSRQWKTQKLKVHYYRTRDEYLQVLKKMTDQPVEITKGMYFPSTNVAYFFFDPNESNDTTLFHEATHLLLSGSRPQTGIIGQRAHFWIVEGIACYMESFQRRDGRLSVGDPSNERIRAAQYHLLQDQYYLPLREFGGMGMLAFQSHKEIRKNYSQAAALAHFFLHYENGKYRDALIEHLSQIYSPQVRVRNDPQSLSDLLDVADEELDQEYAEYIQALDTRPRRDGLEAPLAP